MTERTKRPGGLDDFSDAERAAQTGFARMRTRLLGPLVRPLSRWGVEADHITLVGLLLLVPYAVFFETRPLLAFAALLSAVLVDALDGVYARVTGTADDAGAFTDLCADQVGMVVTVLLVIHHGLAVPVLAATYVVLYLVVVSFSVLQNYAGVPLQVVLRTKYPLYILAGVWLFTGWEGFNWLFALASIPMVVNGMQSFARLRAHFRREDMGRGNRSE